MVLRLALVRPGSQPKEDEEDQDMEDVELSTDAVEKLLAEAKRAFGEKMAELTKKDSVL